MAEQSLRDKTVKGVAWSGIDNIAQYAVSFIVSIVLARLLTPDDYGLLGIIAIFTAICTTLINAGFTQALIRKKDATDEDYNTVFIVNLLVSLLCYAIIFVCSPLIASFFRREELVSLTRVSSVSMIIGALTLVQQTRLTKRIDFKTQTVITLVSSITSGIIGIVMALIGFGVWALVAQLISSNVIRSLLLWMVNRWTPSFYFSKKSFQELFGFGWKLVASGLLDTIWKELTQVVIGRFYSPAALGQYTRASQFSSLFSGNLTNVIQRVTFPVLSSIQDDKAKMLTAYRKMIKTTMFVTAISIFFLGAIAEPFLYCLIGPKWNEAASYLTVICISASFYPLHSINLNMLQVQGRSDLFLYLEIIKKIIAVGPLLIGVFIGVMPMLYSNIIINVVCFFLNSRYSGKLIGYSSWMQIKDIAPSYCIASIIALSVFFLKYISITYWIILPTQILIGVTVFFLICFVTKNEEYREIKNMISPILMKFRYDRTK